MCLVDDDQVPLNLSKPGQDFVSLCKVKRRDDLFLFQPLVNAELVADVAAFENEELLVEFFFKFALPLECQIRRTDNKDALRQTPELELAYKEPGHDGFPGPGVVGEKEPNPRNLKKIIVNGLQLMRQRIDAGNRKTEVGVKLPSDSERIRLNSEPQQ